MEQRKIENGVYEAPSMEVIRFDPKDDVVCTSGLTEGDGNGDIGGEGYPDGAADGLGLGL